MSTESSSSVSTSELRRRALRGSSIDSRVQPIVDREDHLLDLDGDFPDTEEIDRGDPSSSHTRRSRSRSRSRRGKKLRSRSRSRSRSPIKRPADVGCNVFTISMSKSRQVRKWLVQGLSKDESKALRSKFTPAFEGNFDLICPKLDETMVRYWKQACGKDWRAKLNDFQEKSWQSIQFQMLDVFRPLLNVWNQLPPDSPLLNGMEASLQLLGTAFVSVSKLRRGNAMRHVAPDLIPLLKDDRIFSSREYERLFGEKFLSAMVKDAEDFDKVKKIGRSSGPLNKTSGSRGNWTSGNRNGDMRNHSSSGGFNDKKGGFHGFSDKGNNSKFGQSSSKAFQNANRLVSLHSFSPDYSLIGGRLSKFAYAWNVFTKDPWVLSTVMLGYEIDFVSSPVQHSMPPDCIMSREMHLICDSEVKALLDKGAIKEVSVNTTDGFISSMFAIHKKTGGWRPIINLKNLNSFIRYKHFKMEGIDCVKYLLQKGDWMVKIDLQDAYFLVPVSPRFFKFLRFFWNGSLFEYLCLPFGLCFAPRVFTKLLKPVVSFLRERGIRLIVYLDDILILNQSLSGILKDLEEVINLLEFLGFIINYKKSVVVPQQILEYLGLVIDSNKLSLSLPHGKIDSVTKLCFDSLEADRAGSLSLRDLAKVMGNFSWAIPAVPFAQGHFRKLQSFYLSHSHGDLSKIVSLSQEARTDLFWWATQLESANGKSFFPDNPDLVIFSDASLKGWGAVCEGSRTRGPWPLSDTHRHINELELLGALFALKTFTALSANISVLIFLDNSTAVAYINIPKPCPIFQLRLSLGVKKRGS